MSRPPTHHKLYKPQSPYTHQPQPLITTHQTQPKRRDLKIRHWELLNSCLVDGCAGKGFGLFRPGKGRFRCLHHIGLQGSHSLTSHSPVCRGFSSSHLPAARARVVCLLLTCLLRRHFRADPYSNSLCRRLGRWKRMACKAGLLRRLVQGSAERFISCFVLSIVSNR